MFQKLLKVCVAIYYYMLFKLFGHERNNIVKFYI